MNLSYCTKCWQVTIPNNSYQLYCKLKKMDCADVESCVWHEKESAEDLK